MKIQKLFILMISYIAIILVSQSVRAEIIPDKTLGHKSANIHINGNKININGGLYSGSTLFLSFFKFNIGKYQSAIFNASNQTKTIFARVTGKEISKIFGNLSSDGNQNIFFLNPNGIIFGPSASININGSFFATTASGVKFADGSYFNSDGTQYFINPRNFELTFDNPGNIYINNDGHNTKESTYNAPLTENTNPGIISNQNNTIGFIGGDVYLNGGIVSGNSSDIYIGAVESGRIGFQISKGSWIPTFNKVLSFGNINLINKSLISTTNKGSIYLYGSNITLANNSGILQFTNNTTHSGLIKIVATNSITLQNADSDGSFRSTISTQATGNSKSAAINITAKDLNVLDGAVIGSKVFGESTGGDINIGAKNSINVSGFNPNLPFTNQFSAIASITLGNGNSGNLNIEANTIDLLNGGDIGSATFSSGDSGNVKVKAKDTINVIGSAPGSYAPSTINAATFGTGNAGSVNITTGVLNIGFGGRIGTSTLNSGNAGDLFIKASKSISLIGLQESPLRTSVESAAIVDPILQALFDLPPVPTGEAGDVTLITPSLSLKQGAEVTVLNQGLGNAGKVSIDADFINLEDSRISATTLSGDGGNTIINTNILVLQNSKIDSSANKNGNGGNTTINANGIAGDYQSAISANADQGIGGNIDIDTLALVFPASNITATSQRGVEFDGSINIKSVGFTRIDQVEKQPILLGRSLPEICNTSINEHNFLITSADIPDEVDDLRETDSNYSRIPYSIDNKTGKKILDIGIQGWVKRPDGKGVPVAFNNLAFGGSYLVNACRELSKKHEDTN